ncbi:MAG: TIGR04053 family radical SAM/SPASM domain-containing protein [Elusimicrobiota bacterium]
MSPGIGRPSFGSIDYDLAPLLVIWETTRSCALACRHCRADADLGRDPAELTTEEGRRLMDETARMGTPIFILSGGDPFNRPDLEDLIRHGKSRGLRVGTIPAATENLTRERVQSMKAAGLDQIAFSLDAHEAGPHDEFRRTPGAFQRTLDGVRFAHEAGIPVQINTCFALWNIARLEEMAAFVRGLDIVFWEVFFLVPTGRGRDMGGVSARQFEEAFERLHRLSREVRFHVKLTEAQHYHRFLFQRKTTEEDAGKATPRPPDKLPPAVNSGKGFVFVDHNGNVCPSGFLPIAAGNLRGGTLPEIYRTARIFRELRDPALLKGKCGACEFAAACGGSRARAYALTGDYLASDPFCAYIPASMRDREP